MWPENLKQRIGRIRTDQSGKKKKESETHGYQQFPLLVFRVTFTLGQLTSHVIRKPFKAAFAHGLQIHLHKFIPDGAGMVERGDGCRTGGGETGMVKRWQKGQRGEEKKRQE